jgi:hypothetical protein
MVGVDADPASKSVFAGNILKGQADLSTAVSGTVSNTDVFFQAQGAAKIVVDSANNIFSSCNYLMFSRLDQSFSRNINFKLGSAFEVVEDSKAPALRHIIYQNGTALYDTVIDLTNINNSAAPDPQVKVNNKLANKLCMPGTTIRGVRDIINDNEGNLLISDSSNARVLKYRIRDASGNLKLNYCN